ncbi:hypothetical protein ACWAUC_19760 [Bradyrhizobium guangdongense]
MSEPAISPPSQPSASPVIGGTARDNSGRELPPLAAHQQRPDPAPGPDAHRRAQMTAGELAQLEMADQLREAQSVVHKRHPDGTVTIEPRKPGSEQPPKPDAPASEASVTATDKVRVGQYEISETELGELLQRTGLQDLGVAIAPARAEDYQARLPEGFKLPQGIEFKLDENSPLLADARRFAHENRLSQGAFEQMVAMHASVVAGDEAQIATARAAEIAKLGATATSRVTAVNTWLEGILGTDLAKPMKSVMATAGIVQGWEKIMGKFQSQGAASFSQSHREPGSGSKVTEEQWATMSSAAKLEYARSHSQGAR